MRQRELAASSRGLGDDIYTSILHRTRTRPERIHHLNVGDSWMPAPPAAEEALAAIAADPHAFQYTAPRGTDELTDGIRRRLRARYDADVTPDRLQITAGATGGISVVVQTLVEPGAEVILCAPYWPLIRGIVSSRGGVPVEVPFFDRLGDPSFDPAAAIAGAVTDRTVAIYVNTPNNPTGRIASAEVLAEIARIARERDLWLLLDETYEDMVYGRPVAPLWLRDDVRDRAIAVHTFSKAYAMAGARVGYVHGPADVMARVRGVHLFQVYAAARPMQTVAARVLAGSDAWLADATRAHAEAGRRAAQAFGLPIPEAGTFVFLDCAPYLAPGETVTDLLVRCLEAGVLLAPGAACGAAYATWARACFTVVPPDALDDALARLAPIFRR